VRVDRRRWLQKIGRLFAFQLAAELERARAVVEVHADDGVGRDGGCVDRVRLGQAAPVVEHERFAVEPGVMGPASDYDPAQLLPWAVQDAHSGSTFPPSTLNAIEKT
jgi:hypothetical protein